MESKERIHSFLILGGCGFIGRSFVQYLENNHIPSSITVADKRPPIMCHLDPKQLELFKNRVKFIQADLSLDTHVQRLFANGAWYDFIINCCGETRYGQPKEVYETQCVAITRKVSSNTSPPTKWIEISFSSDGKIYSSNDKAKNESAKTDPWTNLSAARLQCEGIVASSGLPYVILRPALVYGPGDITSLQPKLCNAAVYKYLNEKMSVLWSGSLRYNVVHIEDLCTALYSSCKDIPSGSIFNVADSSNFTQEALHRFIEKIFRIKTSFAGTFLSNFARLYLDSVASDANEKHLPAWQSLCEANSIEIDTPASPYIDKELLYNNHLCIDGTAIKKYMQYRYPEITEQLLRDQLQYLINLKLFPDVINK